MSSVTLAGLHRFFRQVSGPASHAAMLGGAVAPTPLNRWVIMGVHPRQTLALKGDQLLVGHEVYPLSGTAGENLLFELLDHAQNQAEAWPEEKQAHNLPMAGGLVGVLGYGFYRWCDSGWQQARSEAETSWPEAFFCEFEDWLLVDLESGALVVLSGSSERKRHYQALWQQACSWPEPITSGKSLDDLHLAAYQQTFSASFTPVGFEAAVMQLKSEIRRGEIYQANLSIRLEKDLALDPYLLFEQLCRQNPSPFSGFLKWPGAVVVSNSPERLVQLDERGAAQARPIAGTRGRGQTPDEDGRIGQTLLENEKERAEHLMLVDLIRNDLGRVCKPGSVTVDELLVLERYSHVTHLVSNVRGQLSGNKTGWDLLRSVFPGGTITGCPKIRCVQILEGIEPVSRGLYTGSMGYLDAASGAMDWNILIRSLFLQETATPLVYNTAVHIGAGIVHDAVEAHEYRECLRKAAASLNQLYQLETTEPCP